MTLNWYVLQVRPRHEKAVAAALTLKELETYVPMYRSLRTWADRNKELELPLFTGYVFCRFDPQRRVLLQNTTGIVQVVGIGKTPAPIEELEIHNLQRLEQTQLEREPCPYPEAGEEVLVCEGPLKGMSGLFVKVNRSSRLLLSVKLLHRAVAVEVDQAWIVPAHAGKHGAPRQTISALPGSAAEGSACY